MTMTYSKWKDELLTVASAEFVGTVNRAAKCRLSLRFQRYQSRNNIEVTCVARYKVSGRC
jgi:hypothetical protein